MPGDRRLAPTKPHVQWLLRGGSIERNFGENAPVAVWPTGEQSVGNLDDSAEARAGSGGTTQPV
jgi:hypothetical protein